MLKAEYAGFQRGRTTDNEPEHPGFGVTVAYHGREGEEATIYVYDLGRKDIPDGPMSDLARAEFDTATREVIEIQQMALGASVQLVGRYGTGSPDRGPEFLCSEFIVTSGHRSVRSFLYLTGAKGNFVKIRVSLQTDDETDATAREFADAVAQGLWHGDDGACPAGTKCH